MDAWLCTIDKTCSHDIDDHDIDIDIDDHNDHDGDDDDNDNYNDEGWPPGTIGGVPFEP